jgi:hypothetical protein
MLVRAAGRWAQDPLLLRVELITDVRNQVVSTLV